MQYLISCMKINENRLIKTKVFLSYYRLDLMQNEKTVII